LRSAPPRWGAHGKAQSGTFHDGAKNRCRVAYQDLDGYRNVCVQVEWADGMFPYNPAPRAADHWQGTLLTEKRDASGLLYRRNRYYDPAMGRFTQEDPIGLAGGVNVYGFAEGVPVTYSDPYGLGPCDNFGPMFRSQCERAVESMLGTAEATVRHVSNPLSWVGVTQLGEAATGISDTQPLTGTQRLVAGIAAAASLTPERQHRTWATGCERGPSKPLSARRGSGDELGDWTSLHLAGSTGLSCGFPTTREGTCSPMPR
jgi:RHS repeat-associated protein